MRSQFLIAALSGIISATNLMAQGGIDRYIPPSPTPAGFIHDGGPVLGPADLASLNARIEALQASGRGDIGVAIIRDIGDYPPYEVGNEIYRAWRIGSVDSIGSERRDLGVLLLIVPKELAPSGRGECWIATGVGGEGYITDGTAGTICRETIIPHLRERDFAGAIGAGIDAIAAELSGVETTQAPQGMAGNTRLDTSQSSKGFSGALLVLLALGGGGGGLVVWRRHKRRKPRLCPQGHGRMRLLDEKSDDLALESGQAKEESVKSVDYDVWECGECGDRLVLRYKRWFTSYGQCPSCKFWTLKSRTRTLVPATTASGGMAETTRTCQNCQFADTRRHATPRISSSSSSGGGSSSSGRSFGGSGRSAGGGGGSSY